MTDHHHTSGAEGAMSRDVSESVVTGRLLVLQSKRLMLASSERRFRKRKAEALREAVDRLRDDIDRAQRAYRSALVRLCDHSESDDSRSCGSTTAPSVVAARVPAGSCSTVARWPAHKRVTRTTCPSGNSSAS